jgi:hypothetical protein
MVLQRVLVGVKRSQHGLESPDCLRGQNEFDELPWSNAHFHLRILWLWNGCSLSLGACAGGLPCRGDLPDSTDGVSLVVRTLCSWSLRVGLAIAHLLALGTHEKTALSLPWGTVRTATEVHEHPQWMPRRMTRFSNRGRFPTTQNDSIT